MDSLSKHHRWRREAVELSALFLAVATADLVADVVVHGHDGPVLLVTAAVALLGSALFHAWWTHRHRHAPPGPDPTDRPVAAVSPAEAERAATPGRIAAGATLWRIRTTVADAPGNLASLSGALARLRVNIISLQTHPLATGTVDEFLVQSPAEVERAQLAGAVVAAGGRDTWIDRADAHDLVDVPTRILGLATRTALDAAELPVALRQLLGTCSIRTLPPAPEHEQPEGPAEPQEQPPHAVDGEVMRLREPSGGVIELSRPHLPFTPTEFARARALVELDAVLGPRVPAGREVVTLPAGSEITVRRVGPDDRPAALEMHGRCSAETLRRRYHGPVGDADRYLGHLLEPRHGQTLAAELPDGRIVGLAHLMWDGEDAEVAVLVEDAWQRRGLGVGLLHRLAALAAEAGVGSLYAVTQSANTAMVAAMRRLDVPLDYQVEDGTLVVTAHLERPAQRVAEPWAPPRS
ncbi:GNAT family N-acetyltransferase [Peterkaempfera bronchialis]|uniref:GNAT family N-acetyltransferase n=1 Tax=Peterkaempfera bronchialis TaxID=2126346 RepID=A0A345SRS6_9ACTN|nr:GNAT family N-acetyltransferase [Peterkaempfera bronchialis]AXI76431.1 GNAT family N-acetyltransferase [Peterkaempfera bronchialis]